MGDPEKSWLDLGRNTIRGIIIGSVVAVIILVVLIVAYPGGGNHRTPHAPMNPAFAGSPSESDHTNTDIDDQAGHYAAGDALDGIPDDNMEHVKGSAMAAAPAPAPAAAAMPDSAKAK